MKKGDFPQLCLFARGYQGAKSFLLGKNNIFQVVDLHSLWIQGGPALNMELCLSSEMLRAISGPDCRIVAWSCVFFFFCDSWFSDTIETF